MVVYTSLWHVFVVFGICHDGNSFSASINQTLLLWIGWLDGLRLFISPLSDAWAKAFISNWVSLFRVPHHLTSECVPQFMVALWSAVAQALRVTLFRTTACHLQSNSLVEQLHWTLKDALQACLTSSIWLEVTLGAAWFVYNPQTWPRCFTAWADLSSLTFASYQWAFPGSVILSSWFVHVYSTSQPSPF